ncbi:alpha/beta hydrolase [Amycolatopsis sp. CA-230715]|uniref:alpha/beta hydrolase n=1 Tax=Amycolatopsis sp. CA-230715 TaxID=2745196 RepID=UPI001C0201D9|nr:alpha/beta hydrolase [Amycolatopsis sp. CA-230715]QWF80589.1 Tripeptidyl aminopeptidase [Amycolatopsis sp. CA-230715]
MTKLHRALLVPAVAGTVLAGLAPVATADPPPLNSTGIPDRYANQALNWHVCAGDELPSPPPAGAEGMECATYLTPRDWSRVDDRIDLTIAVSRLKATGAEATASVLTNPGGPGAPGRLFPARLRNQAKLRASQEVIGIDPRGTGKSTNLTCGGAVGTGSSLDPRNRDRANLDLILDATKYAAESCQLKSGELGPLVTTDQTVHDLDLLRVLLKRDKVNWVGYSAGTWLGAHYAQAFPDRTGRFVLDSNTEFTTTWEKSFASQPLGFERRWRQDFLPWLAKYDSRYHFGATGEAARQTYEEVRYALSKNPAAVGDTTISANQLDSYIASQLYAKGNFPALADYLTNVRTLTKGGATADQKAAATQKVKGAKSAPEITGPQPLRVPGDYADAYDASFWTIPCSEGAWAGSRESAIEESQEFIDRQLPLLGAGWLIQPCLFWKHQPAPLPVLDGKGVPPVLMVQSAHDPATPIEGAERAHRAFAGSRMITVTKEGDHGIYAGGNAAVDKVVEDYLVDGKVPEDQSIPGLPLPVPPEPKN